MLIPASVRQAFHATFFAPWSVRLQTGWSRLFAGIFNRPSPITTRHAERIVIVKLDRIGDFVLLTPFLRELRRNYPDAWITLVVSDFVRPLAAPCPHVNEVLSVPRPAPGLRGTWRHWRNWRRLAASRLQPLRPTLAILPRWEVDLYDAFALLAFSGAARRISYSSTVNPFKAQRNRGADRLLTEAVATTPDRHDVQRNLHLLRTLGLAVRDEHEELWPAANARQLRQRHLAGREDHRLIALSPHSAEEIKDWPFDRFLAVVRHFANQPRLTFVLFAGPEYAEFARQPAARALSNLVALTGQLTLDESAALLTECELVLTVDTGLMHMANALQRPLVVVSSWPTGGDPDSHYSPARFGPWQREHCQIVAPPAGTPGPRFIDSIGIDQVTAAVATQLAAQR